MSEYSLKTLKEHIIQLDVHEKSLAFNQLKIDELNKSKLNHQKEINEYENRIGTLKNQMSEINKNIQ